MKKAQSIYRIVNDDGKDDVDMTRAEAVRIYQELRRQLWPRVRSEKRKAKRR